MPCVQRYDYQFYYHMTVVPTCIFLVLHHILDYWYTKKFHLIPPFQYLIDNDSKRMYYIFTFGALSNVFIRHLGAGKIIDVDDGNVWYLKPFLSALLLAEIAFIYYPIFACFCSRYVIFSRSYGLIHMIFLMVQDIFQMLKENCLENNLDEYFFVITFPGLICSFVVLLCFLKEIIFCIKDQLFIESIDKDIVNSRQITHVKKLLGKKNYFTYRNGHLKFTTKQWKYLVWRNNPCFRYSSALLGALSIIYQYYLAFLCFVIIIIQNLKLVQFVIFRILLASCIISILLFTGLTLRLLVCHRRNILKMYQGKGRLEGYSQVHDIMANDTLLPYHQISVHAILQPYMHFMGYFIAFNIVGSIILVLIISGFIYLIYLIATFKFFNLLMKLLFDSLFVSVIIFSLQFLLVKFVFSEKQGNNTNENYNYWIRNLKQYHILVYFTLFGNLIMGFCSSLLTIFLTTMIQLASLGRLDYSVLNTKYFLRVDRGYRSYLAFLKIQSMYSNPSMKCFCQILLESDSNYVGRKFQYNGPRFSLKARNRWHLAVMLIKNESLRQYRRKIASNMMEEVKIQYSEFTNGKSAILEA